MKALKSELAKQVLADPAAKDKLRQYLVSKQTATAGKVIEVHSKGRTLRVTPVVVSKAA